MFEELKKQNINKNLLKEVEKFRSEDISNLNERIVKPEFVYYGKEVWEMAITAILSGENLLLSGPKATGKNVLASNLAYIFNRPQRNISFHINTDYNTLIGSDTFKNGEVVFRKGPIYECAVNGGFGILDEINMAKNDAIAVLHAVLDHRRIIDIPGYEKINLGEKTRFIATMNYGYVGTKELNEALTSRFMVIDMPNITSENLKKLLSDKYPSLKEKYRDAFVDMFSSLQLKSENGEISTKSVDLRGLIGSINMMKLGLNPYDSIKMAMINKSFDSFEKKIIEDSIKTKIPLKIDESIFND
ncbi:AAA family ATPase [Fusobacterium gastrosuis]|uniref:AAA family ATPase n=1 Tax=Fusobacterium gastrosuis TaxID=1755100 RepID=UPI00297213DD|nr:AAA family ATPase [Peptoniphilaceae bacterium]MDD7383398.1 AAA family ATPase [Peptoniphilaceae bacterium]MDD7410238.1 AAA family ATPase [Fusobacteriaceae bacterium]MDY3738231.1 AAA family ATPase [Peptoniphilaceae bacterium]MDY5713879.1 AAA family ATPase [Fusobacterium gastrosuis]